THCIHSRFPPLEHFPGEQYGVGFHHGSLAGYADFFGFSRSEGAAYHCALADTAVLADDGVADDGTGLNYGSGHDYGVLYQSPLAHIGADGDDAVTDGAENLGALCDEAVDGDGTQVYVAGGVGIVPGVNLAVLAAPEVKYRLL